MSESHDQPLGPPDGDAAPAAPPLMSVPGSDTEPPDDTPTIISRQMPRPGRVEDAFAHGLRGRRLAHYELIEPIGVGGMAAVIRARDTQLDRTVALKILPPEMAADPENVRRFQQEARAAARLDHENIARVFFCGEDQGLHFIAFEFVDGDNLRAILERQGRLSVAEAVHYLLQVALGLAHAAERGVVHRDIKPSNIIITPGGRAKLVDMGLARSLHRLGHDDLTQSGVTLGTFDYISPEQALEPREADVRSDIYSLGCTFYQLLTGQSPVPEGTAAKKLHHHQYVDPVDPRQLNPSVPDDLAAVLACMMAKDPEQRYQQPAHLVKHLHQLARRLGVEAEVPDEIRHIDVPLPRASSPARPALLVAAAALLLVVVVVLHGMTARPGAGTPAARDADSPEELPTTAARTANAAPAAPKEPAADGGEPAELRRDVRTAGDLRTALQKKGRKARLLLTQDIELAAEDAGARTPGLVTEGTPDSELVIEPKEPEQRRVIRLKYDPDSRGGAAAPDWTALTVKGGRVTLRNVRLEIDASAGPGVAVAGVKLLGGELVLENCELIQYNPSGAENGRLTSVLVEGPPRGGAQPAVRAAHCYFAREYREDVAGGGFQGGQEAVAVSGAATVKLTGCAFAPHAALVHLRAGCSAEVALGDDTVLVHDGAVVLADAGAAARIGLSNSLFSRPEVAKPEGPAARAVLIQQAGASDALTYEGGGNRYHNLSAFVERSGAAAVSTVDEFRQWAQLTDDLQLDRNPWVARDPLQLLKSNQPEHAFAPDTSLPELRRPDKRTLLVGTDRCAGWHVYLPPLVPLGERVARTKKLIVDPSRGHSEAAGVYPTLGAAVLHAEPGDEIQLRFNGPRAAGVFSLEKSSLDLTLKPYAGYRPVLTLGDTSVADVSLFRIGDGTLRFQGLEFLLKPRQRDFKETQAVVMVAGLGRCEFEDCVITLDSDRADAAMDVAALADPSTVMARTDPPPDREQPKLSFKKCFVRGRGDLLAVRASRPFALEAEQCLFALNGSLLTVDGNAKEREDASGPSESPVSLKRVTGYLTGNLVLVRAGKGMRDLVPTRVNSEDCMFVSSGTGEALIHFEGDFTKNQIQKLLAWTGSHNAYTNFARLLDQQQQGFEMPEPSLGPREWPDFAHEPGGAFDKVKLVNPSPEGPLARAPAEQFKVLRSEADGDTDYGPAVEDLPKPRAERTGAAPTAEAR